MRNPEKETELTGLPSVTLLSPDVTNPERIKSTVEKAVTIANIDVVFNNAGYGLAGPREAISDSQILRMVNTNMPGAIRVTKEFIPYFRAKRSGLFINSTPIVFA